MEREKVKIVIGISVFLIVLVILAYFITLAVLEAQSIENDKKYVKVTFFEERNNCQAERGVYKIYEDKQRRCELYNGSIIHYN